MKRSLIVGLLEEIGIVFRFEGLKSRRVSGTCGNALHTTAATYEKYRGRYLTCSTLARHEGSSLRHKCNADVVDRLEVAEVIVGDVCNTLVCNAKNFVFYAIV